jgi:hypothetical protein
MCGGGDKPDQTVPVVPAPAPIAQPVDITPVQSADQRRRTIAALKFGTMSTILNAGGARGITGQGPDVQSPVASGQKKTLGG